MSILLTFYVFLTDSTFKWEGRLSLGIPGAWARRFRLGKFSTCSESREGL